MKGFRRILCAGLLFGLLCVVPAQGETDHPVIAYLRRGEPRVDVGGLFIHHGYDGDRDKGLGAGFIELEYAAPSIEGFTWGVWWMGLRRAWEVHSGDYDAVVKKDHGFREAYALYDLPSTRTRIQAGRFYMRDTAIDGNSHQGVRIVSEDISRLRLNAGVVDRWAKYHRVHPNFLGMTGWTDVSTVHEQAGSTFWFGSVRGDLGTTGYVEPFFRYQKNVLFLQGMDWDLGVERDRGERWGFDGSVVRYGNEWPGELRPDYEDAYAWLLHGYRERDDIRIGAGWHGVSRHTNHMGAGMFFWIDPLTVDETIPYDARNDSQLFYTDARIRRENWRLIFRYGYGIARPIGVYSHEVNVFGHLDLTPSVTWGTLISANRYSGDRMANYLRVGMTLTVRCW